MPSDRIFISHIGDEEEAARAVAAIASRYFVP